VISKSLSNFYVNENATDVVQQSYSRPGVTADTKDEDEEQRRKLATRRRAKSVFDVEDNTNDSDDKASYERIRTGDHDHDSRSYKSSGSCSDGKDDDYDREDVIVGASAGRTLRCTSHRHPFLALIIDRFPQPTYHSRTNECPWVEDPCVTTIRTPFPVSIWSIQGPEEIDLDDENDMMDLRDGVLVPKLNIQKLQAVANCFSTKPGIPATPGSMSPLQRTCMKPMETRRPVVMSLGPPSKSKIPTLLISLLDINGADDIHINEPDDLSDQEEMTGSDLSEQEEMTGDDLSEQEEMTGDDNKGSDGESENDSGADVHSQSSIRFDERQMSNEGIEAPPVIPAVADNYAVRKEEQIFIPCQHANGTDDPDPDVESPSIARQISNGIRATANQAATLMNIVNELEADNTRLRTDLRQSNNLVSDVKAQRDALQAQITSIAKQSLISCSDKVIIPLTKSDRARLFELEAENAALLVRQKDFDEQARRHASSMKSTEAELVKLHPEMLRDDSLRAKNQRLLTVILSLKGELDREPASPDVIEQLMIFKSGLALEKAESERLRA
jgi:hypothetical protein